MTDQRAGDEPTVHVHKGRTQHRKADGEVSGRTVCGQWWVATNIGPPATETPFCTRCFPVVTDG